MSLTAWLNPWIERALWCERYRQPLYVTGEESTRIITDYNAAVADDLANGRIDPDDPRAEAAESMDLAGAQIHGVAIMVDDDRARRQREVYKSGVRATPVVGGPLDGEVAPDVALRAEAGWDGHYSIVKDGDRSYGWLWDPADTIEGGD